MFDLKKIPASDVLLVGGLALITGGVAAIYWPAALIFAGAACVAMAFLAVPTKGGDAR